MTEINIEIDAELLLKAMRHAPKELLRNLPMAGMEALREIVDTKGIRNYPPSTAANMPPTPYYIRGQGTQVSKKYNRGESQRYGTSWMTTSYNNIARGEAFADYGEYVSGEKQPAHMAAKGWRKVSDVAKEKVDKLRAIYTKWVQYSLRQAGL